MAELDTGFVKRTIPFGELGSWAPKFDDSQLIPRERWSQLIVELGDDTLSNKIKKQQKKGKMNALDQGQTQYCWASAPVNCVRIHHMLTRNKVLDLSPASVAATIKNYQNLQGNAAEALRFIAERGVAPSSEWENYLYDDRSLNIDNTTAADHKVTKWWDLDPGSIFDQLATCLLNLLPVAVGYDDFMGRPGFGHEVTAVDLVDFGGGQFGIRIWNSYGDGWEEGGFCVLNPFHAIPQDAVAVAWAQ